MLFFRCALQTILIFSTFHNSTQKTSPRNNHRPCNAQDKIYIQLLLVLVYLVVTVRYSFTLLKSPVLPKRLRYLHLVLIWAIPFVCIIFLRSVTRHTPGSYGIDRNKDEKPFFDVFKNMGE